MAISFNNASSGNANDGPLSFEHIVNSGSDRILIVGICIEQGAGALPTVTSVTFDGTGLTQISTLIYKTDKNRVGLWYLLNPPVKTANVVVSLSGGLSAPGGVCAGAITINGAKQQAPEANNSNSGEGTEASVNITTLTDNAWIVDVISNNKSTYDQTAGGGQTERYETTNDQRLNGSTKPVVTAGATSMSWTISAAAYWGMIAAAFEEAAGAPGEKNISDSGSGLDAIGIPHKELLIGDAGAGIEVAATPFKELLISDVGSGIESISGPPVSTYKELFIKRVRYRISPQGIKCDLELGELHLLLEQEILNILRDLKNEKELLQANIKQLSV